MAKSWGSVCDNPESTREDASWLGDYQLKWLEFLSASVVAPEPHPNDFEHWAVVNLPGEATGLDPGISGQDEASDLPGDAYELENGFGFTGYLGSCPPEPHVYRWRLWALSEALPTDLDAFRQVINQSEDAALGLAETCHIYGPRTE